MPSHKLNESWQMMETLNGDKCEMRRALGVLDVQWVDVDKFVLEIETWVMQNGRELVPSPPH